MSEQSSHYNRIKTGTIKPLEPLAYDIYDSQGNLLLSRGHQIENESKIEELINSGLYKKNQPKYTFSNAGIKDISLFNTLSIIEKDLHTLLKTPPLDGSFPIKVEKLVNDIQTACSRSSNATIAYIILSENSFYPVSHSLHVGLLTTLLINKLDWPLETIISSICAALTMNIGMIRLQGELCNVDEPLNSDQKRSIEIHPTLSVSLLKRLGVSDPVWLQTVLEHHERPDGGGYPNKIFTPCESALIVRTCDIFSAKLSPRSNRKPMDVALAAKILFTGEGAEPNNLFPAMLIKLIGIYPPGCLVKLFNGEICIVSRTGHTAHTPIAQLLKNSNGLIVTEAILRDTSKKEFKIQCAISKEEIMIPIDVNKIWV